MQTTKQLLARWESKRGASKLELFAEFGPEGSNLLPSYSYKGNGCGGFLGSSMAPEVAMQIGAQRAADNNSPIRKFYSETVAAECCRLWQVEIAS